MFDATIAPISSSPLTVPALYRCFRRREVSKYNTFFRFAADRSGLPSEDEESADRAEAQKRQGERHGQAARYTIVAIGNDGITAVRDGGSTICVRRGGGVLCLELHPSHRSCQGATETELR